MKDNTNLKNLHEKIYSHYCCFGIFHKTQIKTAETKTFNFSKTSICSIK